MLTSADGRKRTAVPIVLERVKAAIRRLVPPGSDSLAPRAFVMLALTFGLAFAFAVPPTQVVDEEAHFLRVWQLAGANVVTDVRYDAASGFERNGSVFDTCVVEYVREFTAIAATARDYSFHEFWADTPDCSPRERTYTYTDAQTSYGPWAYPGQTVALGIGRAIGLPLPILFYLGRVGGLLLYTGVIWAALRIAPAGRLVIMFAALLPMSLMTAAAYNPDGIMIAGASLASACVLKLVLHPPERPARLLVALVAALAVVIAAKPNYVVLLGLLLLLPRSVVNTRRQYWTLVAGASVGILSLVALWYKYGAGVSNMRIYYPESDPGAQTSNILHHPLGFSRVIWRTLFTPDYETFFFRGWVAVFGMMRSRPGVAVLLPVPFVMLALAVGAAAFATQFGDARPLPILERTKRIVVVGLVIAAGCLSVFYVAYTRWTPPGQRTISGVNARYFVPFVPVLATGVALVRERSNARVSVGAVAIGAIVVGIASLTKIADLFY